MLYRRLWFVLLLLSIALTPSATAQLGQLISPGPLSAPHAKLEGAENCEKCHEQRKRVSATRCLACHEPVAKRIAARKGVHRNVKDDCVSCHVEHMGRSAELRPFDVKKFDHRAETGFPLDGKHAPLACRQCHKTRSFLGSSADCASCHRDPHKGRLGIACTKCHSPAVGFKESSKAFDHSTTAFALDGAHRSLACGKCHKSGTYDDLEASNCASCHKSPHKPSMGNDCRTCHTAANWKVQKFDHARTGTPLAGKHQFVACARCHIKPAAQVKFRIEPCASCHKDPHRGQFKQDCAACHNESGFKGAAFDHKAKTRFALEGRHRPLACIACHKRARGASVDFRGLSIDCASCHTDPHNGQLGTKCDSCHTAAAFKVSQFTHPRFAEFFAGQHAAVACEKCHRGPAAARVYKSLSTDCATCHRDVHAGQLPRCTDCHSVAAAKFAPVGFQHANTKFALTGKHAATECRKCHPQEGTVTRFRSVGTECVACHKDAHAGQLGSNCETCHTTATFTVSTYTHKNPGAFFRGRHASAKCADCHKKVDGVVKFAGIGTNCSACHKDAHRGQLGPACANCHSVDAAWQSASRAFHKAGLFPLEGRHLGVPCADCHRNGVIKGTPHRCYDCHWIRRQDDKHRTRLGNECEECHRPTSWTHVNWDHGSWTRFALSGPHRTLPCDQCHRNGQFGGTPSDCASCHTDDYSGATDPDHRAAGFPLVCQLCHSPGDPSWRPARFNHATFPLAGAHTSQPCASCHKNGVFAGTPRDCASCHKAEYDRSANPNHAAAGFPVSCETCHAFADATWTQARYAHTLWPLLGRHATPSCASCHKSGVYRGLPSDCVSCHRTDYDQSADPVHAAAGFPLACETCHKASDSTWDAGTFEHTTFPLAGTHLTQVCRACHANNVYTGTPRTCSGCHQKAYNEAREPNHIAAGFPLACEPCHQFADPTWKEGRFDHTTFPLAGAHATQACGRCHANSVYRGTPRACVGCHQTDYNNTKDPNHITAGFPTTCDTCHKFSDTTWDQGKFDHGIFPLAGTHTTQPCTACHANGVYRGTPRTCTGCHQTDYNNAKDPNHITAGFPTTCDTCHKFSDTNWDQGKFDHAIFPLAGTHSTQQCAACHANGVYRGTPRTCTGCHQTDYNNAKDPNHITAGFPTACETCHKFSDTTWDQGVFDHSTFPLAGNHLTQVCNACHANGVYRGTPRTCAGCHQADYNRTTSPNHITAGFPTACETCHKFSDTSWQQGVFNHTIFSLAGRHATAPCNACHANGVYRGTPRTCVGCHQADYNSAADPNHIAAGFPTTCDSCHRYADTSWDQGVFNHTSFPITSGPHSGRRCNECHPNASNFQVFTCTTCHTRSETDKDHQGEQGYRYDSVACLSCHPQGRD